jgi:LmbE family N-acetylglucosaminyl deacetylase
MKPKLRIYFQLLLLLITFLGKGQTKRVVCIGAHPDDPESGCGGTLAKYVQKGDSVFVVYLTLGEAGIEGESYAHAANIRTQEAFCAAKVIGYKALFFGQTDGATVVNNEQVAKFTELLDQLKPSIVYTHWPVDSHKDHQIASLLTTQAWYAAKQKFEVYFYEVCAGYQTTLFNPTHFEDITLTVALKEKAIRCHISQKPDQILFDKYCNHAFMQSFRGQQAAVPMAEAFIKWK